LIRLTDPVFRLRLAIFLLAFLFVTGTVGYSILEDLSFFDAFYMTLITISTVGFSEIGGELSGGARVLTACLIVSGLLLVAFSTGTLIESIVEGGLADHFGRRRLAQRVAELNDHWIICGYGRMGEMVAKSLLNATLAPSVVIIDRDKERLADCQEAGLPYVAADATTEEALDEAGIKRAKGLVSLVASDAENVFICLTAREMAPDLMIIARSLEERSESKLRRAGANKVVSPYLVGGHRLSQAVLQPAVAEFLEFAAGHDLQLELEESQICSGSPLAGKQLKDSGLRSDLELIVLAIRRGGGEMIFNPGALTVLEEGDTLIVMGPGQCLVKLHEHCRNNG
jgi:voltage-gated potassium channel